MSHKVCEAIFIKETRSTLIRDKGHELSKIYNSLLKCQELLGCRQQRVPKVDQSVRIQLPSAEDREGFLQNVLFKNVSVVEQF